jgi:thiamine-phosphate pyrophosphorylase
MPANAPPNPLNPLHRLIDASANRAREGLRVMEDTARFVLNDAPLTAALKSVRHALRAELATLPIQPLDLLAARDTPGDVGTAISTTAELNRAAGLPDLVTAAAKRTQEALRSLEEASKALARDGKGFESARYRVYDLERSLLLRLAPPCPQWRLCVLITRALCTHHAPEEILRRAAAGGADCVQIREKDLPDAERLDHTARLVELAHALGLHAVVNDRPDIARLSNADAVHLGQTDLPVQAARSILGPARWIGVSCSTLDHARRAHAQGANSIGLGPIFLSTTKTKPTLSGLDLLRAVAADPVASTLPHLAISGITPANAAEAARAGARGLAISSAVCAAEDPAAVCRSLLAALDASTRPSDRSLPSPL